MRRLLSFISLLSSLIWWCSGRSSPMWYDAFSVEEDLNRLDHGDNLIYLVAGGERYLNSSLQLVTGVFSDVLVNDMKCIDVSVSQNPLREFEHFLAITNKLGRKGRVLLFVHNFEDLTGDFLKRLDFLFRITDRSAPFANAVVVLFWNKDSHPFNIPENEEYTDLKTYVGTVWSAGGELVNGAALAGRISRAAEEVVLDTDDTVAAVAAAITGTSGSGAVNNFCNSIVRMAPHEPVRKLFGSQPDVDDTLSQLLPHRTRGQGDRERSSANDYSLMLQAVVTNMVIPYSILKKGIFELWWLLLGLPKTKNTEKLRPRNERTVCTIASDCITAESQYKEIFSEGDDLLLDTTNNVNSPHVPSLLQGRTRSLSSSSSHATPEDLSSSRLSPSPSVTVTPEPDAGSEPGSGSASTRRTAMTTGPPTPGAVSATGAGVTHTSRYWVDFRPLAPKQQQQQQQQQEQQKEGQDSEDNDVDGDHRRGRSQHNSSSSLLTITATARWMIAVAAAMLLSIVPVAIATHYLCDFLVAHGILLATPIKEGDAAVAAAAAKGGRNGDAEKEEAEVVAAVAPAPRRRRSDVGAANTSTGTEGGGGGRGSLGKNSTSSSSSGGGSGGEVIFEALEYYGPHDDDEQEVDDDEQEVDEEEDEETKEEKEEEGEGRQWRRRSTRQGVNSRAAVPVPAAAAATASRTSRGRRRKTTSAIDEHNQRSTAGRSRSRSRLQQESSSNSKTEQRRRRRQTADGVASNRTSGSTSGSRPRYGYNEQDDDEHDEGNEDYHWEQMYSLRSREVRAVIPSNTGGTGTISSSSSLSR